MSINTKLIQDQAKKELDAERMESAKEHLKHLYIRKEKAALVLRNIDKEIEGFIKDVEDLTTFESAGVDVSQA